MTSTNDVTKQLWRNRRLTKKSVSGCDSVGRAVTSDARDQGFESSHRQVLYTINFIAKTKTNKKGQGMVYLWIRRLCRWWWVSGCAYLPTYLPRHTYIRTKVRSTYTRNSVTRYLNKSSPNFSKSCPKF